MMQHAHFVEWQEPRRKALPFTLPDPPEADGLNVPLVFAFAAAAWGFFWLAGMWLFTMLDKAKYGTLSGWDWAQIAAVSLLCSAILFGRALWKWVRS